MQLLSLRPMIYTENLDQTIQFYTEILSFTLAEKNDDWGWASLYKDQVAIMLAKPNEHTEFTKATFTGSFYFNTDNVDEMWEHLKDKTKICYEPETFDWGMKEFGIYDNNGYLLQFGQHVEQ